jgi:histidyl-tRNA synthetase
MFKSLPGFRDFYPEDCAVRNHLFRSWRKTAQTFNFKEYDGPILESLDLFKQKSGDEIVGQLFAFEDKGGRSVALRPEMTPSLARMIGARANALKRPIKWFCIEENFRYERMQKGRLRSFYQFNADIFGEPGPGADAEIVATLIQSLTVMGLGPKDFVIRISDRHLWVLY